MKNNILTENILLNNYTTIKVGGIAEYFAEPRNVNEFVNLVEWSNFNNRKCQIIGAGSNLLINDIFIKGLIICTKKMRSITIDPHSGFINADAGVMLPTLANSLAKQGLQGGEWAVGIPGTLGGAICMNAGSGNLSLANNLISVKAINTETLEALEIEKKVMFLILFLIIFVAAFNLISSIIMIVNDKERGIGILRSLGAKRSEIQRIFIIVGSLVGLLGTTIGTFIGVIVSLNIGKIQKFLLILVKI